MESAYKAQIQDATRHIGNYKRDAQNLVQQFSQLGPAAPKVLLTVVLNILKDKKTTTHKLLALLVLDDATATDCNIILSAFSGHKLAAYMEKAVNKGSGFVARLTKDEAIDSEVVDSITSYMLKWSSHANDVKPPNCSQVQGWHQKNFAGGHPLGFNAAKYLQYRPVGEFLDDGASLVVGGLRQPDDIGGYSQNEYKRAVSGADAVRYDAEEAKKMCSELSKNNSPDLRYDAQLMISYFEQLANEAAGNENFEEYEKAAEIVSCLHAAVKEHEKLEKGADSGVEREAPKTKGKEKKEKKKKRQGQENEDANAVSAPNATFFTNSFPLAEPMQATMTQASAPMQTFNSIKQQVQLDLDNISVDGASREAMQAKGMRGSMLTADTSKLQGQSFNMTQESPRASVSSIPVLQDPRGAGSTGRWRAPLRTSVEKETEQGEVDEAVPEEVSQKLQAQMKLLEEMTQRQTELSDQLKRNITFQQNEFSQSVIARQKAENSARDLNQMHQMAVAQYRSTETKNEENKKGLALLRGQNAKLANERNELSRQLAQVQEKYQQLEGKFQSQEEVLANARERLLNSQSKLADCMQELETRKDVQKTLQQRLYEARTSQREADNQVERMRNIFDSTECTMNRDAVEFRSVEPSWDAYEVAPKVQLGDELAPPEPEPSMAVSSNKEVLQKATFDFPFARLQGAPFSADDRVRLETLYRNLCQASKGVLYSDNAVEVLLNIEASAPLILCGIYVRNVSNANLGDIEVTATAHHPDGPPPLEIRRQGQPGVLCKGQQLEFTARLVANQPFMGCPSINLSYAGGDNSQTSTRIRLPMSCLRLCKPIEVRTQTFFEYWRDPDMEAQSGFRGRVRDIFFAKDGFFLFVKSLECGSLKILPGVAASQDTIVMAGKYPRSARRAEILVRADLNHTDRSIEVVVRSSSFLISSAVARALADSVVINQEDIPQKGSYAYVQQAMSSRNRQPSQPRSAPQIQHSPWYPPDPRLNVDDWRESERVLGREGRDNSSARGNVRTPDAVGNGSCRFLRPSNVPHRKTNIAS